jgi:hypothetical protein
MNFYAKKSMNSIIETIDDDYWDLIQVWLSIERERYLDGYGQDEQEYS